MKIGHYLGKLWTRVWCLVFYGPRCINMEEERTLLPIPFRGAPYDDDDDEFCERLKNYCIPTQVTMTLISCVKRAMLVESSCDWLENLPWLHVK